MGDKATFNIPGGRQSLRHLMRRLAGAGFSREFVHRAIFPDWWNDECSRDPQLVQDVEIRVARFLGRTLSAVNDPRLPLAPPDYPAAQLRRGRQTDRARLAPAVHAAIRVATAVVRNLRDAAPAPISLPLNGLAWRTQMTGTHVAPTLEVVADRLWKLGVPVVPLEIFPTPSFQGMACIVEDRPVILLGQKHDVPGRIAFIVAHEAGHIAAGDCTTGGPVVDEEDEIVDRVEVELRADRYATDFLVGPAALPHLKRIGLVHFKELARQALSTERDFGADASFVIFSWARYTGDYATAALAVKALYRSTGARRKLRALFDRYVDISTAAETDRSLLLCVRHDSDRNDIAR